MKTLRSLNSNISRFVSLKTERFLDGRGHSGVKKQTVPGKVWTSSGIGNWKFYKFKGQICVNINCEVEKFQFLCSVSNLWHCWCAMGP